MKLQNLINQEKLTEEYNEGMEKIFNIEKTPYKAPKLPNRNDPCTCGSGKKYKNCCMKLDNSIIDKLNNE